MTIAEVARLTLDVALAARIRERLTMTVTPNTVEVVVFDPERDRRIGSSKIEETGYRLHEHKVTIEIRHGVLRVIFVHPSPGDGPGTREERVALDDADAEVVTGMLTRALDVARDPF